MKASHYVGSELASAQGSQTGPRCRGSFAAAYHSVRSPAVQVRLDGVTARSLCSYSQCDWLRTWDSAAVADPEHLRFCSVGFVPINRPDPDEVVPISGCDDELLSRRKSSGDASDVLYGLNQVHSSNACSSLLELSQQYTRKAWSEGLNTPHAISLFFSALFLSLIGGRAVPSFIYVGASFDITPPR